MQAPNSCVFVDQIFACPPALEKPPFGPGQLAGMDSNPHGKKSPPGQPSAPDPKPDIALLADLGEDLVGALASVDSTKVSDELSFDMNSLATSLDLTMTSSIHSMMAHPDLVQKSEKMFEIEAVVKEPSVQMQEGSLFDLTAQCDAESAQYGIMFAPVSPSESSDASDPFSRKVPPMRSGSVQERVQKFEEISRGIKVKREPSSNIPSPAPTCDNTPDVRVKIEEYDGVAPYPDLTPESNLSEPYERDYYNSDRHPMIDGNNSDEEDYSAAANLGAENDYDYGEENIGFNEMGPLDQSSPKKISGKLFVDPDSSRETSTVTQRYVPGLNRQISYGNQWEDSYEDRSWDVPHIFFTEAPSAAECSDTAMEDCESNTNAHAQDLHPNHAQPHDEMPDNLVSRPCTATNHGSAAPQVHLYAPVPCRNYPTSRLLSAHPDTIYSEEDSHDKETDINYVNDPKQGPCLEPLTAVTNTAKAEHAQNLATNAEQSSESVACPTHHDNGDSQMDLGERPKSLGRKRVFSTASQLPEESMRSTRAKLFSTEASPGEGVEFLDIWNTLEDPTQAPEWKLPAKFQAENPETFTSPVHTSDNYVSVQQDSQITNSAINNTRVIGSDELIADYTNYGWTIPVDKDASTWDLSYPGFSNNSNPQCYSSDDFPQRIQHTYSPLDQAQSTALLYQQQNVSNIVSYPRPESPLILPNEIFSDLPKTSVDRVISYRSFSHGIPFGNGMDGPPTVSHPTGCSLNTNPFHFTEPAVKIPQYVPEVGCNDITPRSYFTDPDFLSYPSALLDTFQPSQYLPESLLDETTSCNQQNIEANFPNQQVQHEQPFFCEPTPQNACSLDTLPNSLGEETPDAPRGGAVFKKPSTFKRIPQIVPKHLDDFKITKAKAKPAPSDTKKDLIKDSLNDIIIESNSDSMIKEGKSSTIKISTPAKRQRKGKVAFNYDSVSVSHEVIESPHLQNFAVGVCNDEPSYKNQLVSLNGSGECHIRRTRYQRHTLAQLEDLHPNVYYEKNSGFDVEHPYQQEFTRVELDEATGQPKMETRSALCAYCEEINFYELKNSCYSQHMSHSHGIYTDNFLAPNPLFNGRYQVSKKPSANRKTQPRVRFHEGVVCPACFEVVEIRCWSSTSEKKPLSNYLRHFKERHRVDKRRETFFSLKA